MLWNEATVVWVLVPLSVSVAIHTAIWLLGAFITWNLWWLGWQPHRVIFVVICVVSWWSMISGLDEEKAKESARPTTPPPPKPER